MSRLTDIQVDEVSLVDAAANLRTFLIRKGDEFVSVEKGRGPLSTEMRLQVADAITREAQDLIAQYRIDNQFSADAHIEDHIAPLQDADKRSREAALNANLSDEDCKAAFARALQDIKDWKSRYSPNEVTKGTTVNKNDAKMRELAEMVQQSCDAVRIEYEELHNPHDPKKRESYMPPPDQGLINSLREHHKLLSRLRAGEGSDDPKLQLEIIDQARNVRDLLRLQGMKDVNEARRYKSELIARGRIDPNDDDRYNEARGGRELTIGPKVTDASDNDEDHQSDDNLEEFNG